MATPGTVEFGLTASFAERSAAAQALTGAGWTVEGAFSHVDGTCDRALCCGWDEGPGSKRDEIAQQVEAHRLFTSQRRRCTVEDCDEAPSIRPPHGAEGMCPGCIAAYV